MRVKSRRFKYGGVKSRGVKSRGVKSRGVKSRGVKSRIPNYTYSIVKPMLPVHHSPYPPKTTSIVNPYNAFLRLRRKKAWNGKKS